VPAATRHLPIPGEQRHRPAVNLIVFEIPRTVEDLRACEFEARNRPNVFVLFLNVTERSGYESQFSSNPCRGRTFPPLQGFEPSWVQKSPRVRSPADRFHSWNRTALHFPLTSPWRKVADRQLFLGQRPAPLRRSFSPTTIRTAVLARPGGTRTSRLFFARNSTERSVHEEQLLAILPYLIGLRKRILI